MTTPKAYGYRSPSPVNKVGTADLVLPWHWRLAEVFQVLMGTLVANGRLVHKNQIHLRTQPWCPTPVYLHGFSVPRNHGESRLCTDQNGH